MSEACEIYRGLIARYADGELGDPRLERRVRRHLDRCPDCRRRLGAHDALTCRILEEAGRSRTLDLAWGEPGLLGDTDPGRRRRDRERARRDRVFEAVLGVEGHQRASRWRPSTTAARRFAAAAAILLAALLGYLVRGPSPASRSDLDLAASPAGTTGPRGSIPVRGRSSSATDREASVGDLALSDALWVRWDGREPGPDAPSLRRRLGSESVILFGVPSGAGGAESTGSGTGHPSSPRLRPVLVGEPARAGGTDHLLLVPEEMLRPDARHGVRTSRWRGLAAVVPREVLRVGSWRPVSVGQPRFGEGRLRYRLVPVRVGQLDLPRVRSPESFAPSSRGWRWLRGEGGLQAVPVPARGDSWVGDQMR